MWTIIKEEESREGAKCTNTNMIEKNTTTEYEEPKNIQRGTLVVILKNG